MGYNFNKKSRDNYFHPIEQNTSLLEENTASIAHSVEFEISYSTVNQYYKRTAKAPFNVWFSVSDIFKGTNIQRQTNYALWGMIFF